MNQSSTENVKDTFGILQELKCSVVVITITYIIMAVAGSTVITPAGLTIFTVLSFIMVWINFIISCVTPRKLPMTDRFEH